MSYRSAVGSYTEHNGPKQAKGSWCRKRVAKKASRRIRRSNDRHAVSSAVWSERIAD